MKNLSGSRSLMYMVVGGIILCGIITGFIVLVVHQKDPSKPLSSIFISGVFIKVGVAYSTLLGFLGISRKPDTSGLFTDVKNPAHNLSGCEDNDEENRLNKDWNEFETARGNIVYYRLLSDFDFEDAEDGNTDAYQVYHEVDRAAETYLAFMIDSGYESTRAADIKAKWHQFYGELLEYSCKEIDGVRLKQIVSARTATKLIKSYFYADHDDRSDSDADLERGVADSADELLEVIYEIDLNLPAERREQIQNSFERLISTIQIDTLYEDNQVGCFLTDERVIVHKPVKYCLRVDPGDQTWHGWSIRECWDESGSDINLSEPLNSGILEERPDLDMMQGSAHSTVHGWNGWVLLAEPDDEEYCSDPNNFVLLNADSAEELCPPLINIHAAPYGAYVHVSYEGKEPAGFADPLDPSKQLGLSEIVVPQN